MLLRFLMALFLDRISRRITLVFLSRSPIPSSDTRKPSRPNPRLLLSRNRRTSTIVCSSRLSLSKRSSQLLSRAAKSALVTITRSVLVSLLMSTVGMSPMPGRSGVSVLIRLAPTCSLTPPRVCNILTKSRILASLPSSGLPRRVCAVRRTCVVSE